MNRELDVTNDIVTVPGHEYAVRLSVKDSHSKADIEDLLEKRGLEVLYYADGPPDGGYRDVTMVARARTADTIPTSLPAPLSWFDSTHLLEAIESDGAAQISPTMLMPQPKITAHWWAPTILATALIAAGVAVSVIPNRERRRH